MLIGLGVFTAVFAAAILLAFRTAPEQNIDQARQATFLSDERAISNSTSGPTTNTAISTHADNRTADSADAPVAAENGRIELCGRIRVTCVVDGDTFWFEGQKIRIADIDTPEISQPHCPGEYQRGMTATRRLLDLLNAGPFELRMYEDRDEDSFGRKLRLVTRNGSSIGDQLVDEGLAHRWIGHKQPWC